MNVTDLAWQSYVEFTDETAIYPEAGTGSPLEIAYLTLGYVGELTEALDKISAQDDPSAEIGDCFWYLARFYKLIEKFGAEGELPTLEIGETNLANIAKKYLRGDTSIHQTLLIASKLIEWMIGHPQTEQILMENKLKLLSRKERGVIKGSGDSR